jgi:hypothetical protein
MLEEFLMPILEEEGPGDTLFQQDGAPPHFHKKAMDFLNRKFAEKWFGGAGLSLGHLIRITLLHLFRGYIKHAVYVLPLVTTVSELVGRIRDALATVTLDLLNNV